MAETNRPPDARLLAYSAGGAFIGTIVALFLMKWLGGPCCCADDDAQRAAALGSQKNEIALVAND